MNLFQIRILANKLDIEMHFADDDDFFVKNIERETLKNEEDKS